MEKSSGSTEKSLLQNQNESTQKDKIALVLGGGGSRGYAHLGIAQALKKEGLEPDIIVGTSMGAVIGSAIAHRTNLEGMLKVLRRLDVNDILKISPESSREMRKAIGKSLFTELSLIRRKSPSKPPVRLSRLFTFFKLITRDSSIEDLPLEYAAMTTDLETGEGFLVRKGKVYRATAASSAIPGIIPHVKLDGRLLVDGGVVDILPVLPAVELGADSILAVDVSEDLPPNIDENPLALFYRTQTMRKNELIDTKNSIARDKIGENLTVLSPPVDEINWLDFNQIDEPVALGKECAEDNMEIIEKIFSREGPK